MASDITITGEACAKGYANSPNTFKIQLGGLNVSKLMVDVDGPIKPQVVLTACKDGSMDCTYRTTVEGDYAFTIMFDEEHVEGSPFQIKVEGELIIDTTKVKVTGGGLKEGRNRQFNEVNIDPRDSGITCPLQYSMEGTSKPDISFRNNGNGTFTITYKPYTTGLYKLHLKYMDKPVPGSPFQIRVK